MASQQEIYDQLQSPLAHLPAEIQQKIWEETIPDRSLEIYQIQWRNAPNGKQIGTMAIREPQLGPTAFQVCRQTRDFVTKKGKSIRVTDEHNAHKRLWFYPERDIVTIDIYKLGHLLTDEDVSVDDFDKIHHLGLVWREITWLPTSLDDYGLEDVPRLWYENLVRLKELMPSLETINFFVPHEFAEFWHDSSLSCEEELEHLTQLPSVISPLKDWMELELYTPEFDERQQLFDAIVKTDEEEHTRQLSWETIRDRFKQLVASAASQYGTPAHDQSIPALEYRAWSRKRLTPQ